MGEVVGFPEKEDRIFVCDCGCVTFYAHDEWLECAGCSNVATEDGSELWGGWVLRESATPPVEDFDIHRDYMDEELNFRRIQRDVMDKGIVAVALFYDSGRVRSVGRIAETDEEREWFRRRADVFVQQMDKKNADNG